MRANSLFLLFVVGLPFLLGSKDLALQVMSASAAPERSVEAGRSCRFEIPDDPTVAREMLRLILSGALAPGVETNRCLKPERFMKLRAPKVAPSEELPPNRLIAYAREDQVKILELKSIPKVSPSEQRVRFVLIKANGRRVEDEFSMLLYPNPRLQLLMGCAELLDSPHYRYYPTSQDQCP